MKASKGAWVPSKDVADDGQLSRQRLCFILFTILDTILLVILQYNYQVKELDIATKFICFTRSTTVLGRVLSPVSSIWKMF
jgi:hypothetical protein